MGGGYLDSGSASGSLTEPRCTPVTVLRVQIRRVIHGRDIASEAEKIGHRELPRLGAWQGRLPVSIAADEGARVSFQQAKESLGHDETSHRPEVLALALDLRLFENVVPEGRFPVKTVLCG